MMRSFQILIAAVAMFFASPLFAQLSVPEIPYDSAPNLLKLPENLYLGEAVGVATNSKGHIYVFTRSGSTNVTTGTNRAFVRSSSRLFEFDQTGKYVREMGQGLYGFIFAHAVRVDPQDNIWVIDEGSNMVIKFDPEGRVVMTMGRKPEAIRVPAAPPPLAAPAPVLGGNPAAGGPGGAPAREGPAPSPAREGAGAPGDNFDRPTDVAWDAAGNIFVGEVRQRWKVYQVLGIPRNAAQSISHRTYDRDRRQGQRVRGRPRKQAHSSFRQRRELQIHVHQRRRSLGRLHHARTAPVPVQFKLERHRRHG